MIKFLSFFLLSFSALLATVFDFKESRYYAALDLKRVSYGTISIDKNTTTIEYKKPIIESVVIHSDGAYMIKNRKKEAITNQDALLFLKVFEKLIKDENLERFFTKYEDKLLPKGSLLKESLEYVKKDRKSVIIYLKNGDSIVFKRD